MRAMRTYACHAETFRSFGSARSHLWDLRKANERRQETALAGTLAALFDIP